jgi:hypothetical protein
MKLRKWINDTGDMTWQAAMRFSMVVMSALLFGMHYGQSLPPEIGELCRLFALSGLAFYFSLELVADQRAQRRANLARDTAERKLSRRLQRKDKLGTVAEAAKPSEQGSERIESAMDSSADLAVYTGATAQPVLSA